VTNLSGEERRVYALKQRRLLLQRISGASDAIWKTREDSLAKRMLPRLNQDRTHCDSYLTVVSRGVCLRI
jgi:hypothetical protein